MKKFDLKDLKLGFIAEQEISESSIQTLFNKIREVLFECVKLKAKEIKKDLKSHFDEIMFMKAINRVQTETDPGAKDLHYHIATSNGEFCLTLKMYQLFSLKFFINVDKNIIIENPKLSYSKLLPIFEKICENVFFMFLIRILTRKNKGIIY